MEKEKDKFPVELEDNRSIEEIVDTVVMEPFLGLKGFCLKYGCKYIEYVPPEDTKTSHVFDWEPRYNEETGEETYDENDIDYIEMPHSYFMVQDGAGRDICVVEVCPGDELSEEPYITQVDYKGPPEEKEQWEKMMEELKRLPIY
ncbi:MAG: hypothetical protein ACE5J7_03340 [Candidatus Aenigmatarchaeota archaeon]